MNVLRPGGALKLKDFVHSFYLFDEKEEDDDDDDENVVKKWSKLKISAKTCIAKGFCDGWCESRNK